MDPTRGVFRWAWAKARQHLNGFLVGTAGLTAVVIVVSAVYTLPTSPTLADRLRNGLVALALAIVVVLLITLLFALVVAPYQQRNALRALLGATRVGLEPRYGQDFPYRRPYDDMPWVSEHRIGIHNPPNNPTIDRVRVHLVEMAPLPRHDGGFPPVIPSVVPIPSGGDASIGMSLAPGREELWVIGYTATGSDGVTSAGGFAVPDQRWRGTPWQFEPDERWRFIYRIVCQDYPDVAFSVLMTADNGLLRCDLEG